MSKHREVPAVALPIQPRRKATGPKAWLIISNSGESHVEEVGRHFIMQRTGLPARDLRVLDPVLSYPSSILGRERAIVVNLEHIKAIITAREVLMLYSNCPLVFQFVQDLQHRISSSNFPPQQVKDENGGIGIDVPVVADSKSLPFEFRALEACPRADALSLRLKPLRKRPIQPLMNLPPKSARSTWSVLDR